MIRSLRLRPDVGAMNANGKPRAAFAMGSLMAPSKLNPVVRTTMPRRTVARSVSTIWELDPVGDRRDPARGSH